MNITQEQTDELNAIIKIKVATSDYRENVDKILRDYRKKTNMPGFRPGMVPFGMIKKMYGKGVMADEINKLLSDSLYNYINKNKIDILGSPLPKENGSHVDFDTWDDFEFLYDMGLAPQFSVNISSKEKFMKYVVTTDEKLIDKQVSDYTKQYGKVLESEISGESDMLVGEFTELDKNGKIKEGGIKQPNSIYIAEVPDEKTKKLLMGLKKEDAISVNPEKLFKNSHERAHILRITSEEAEGLKSDFEFKVVAVYNLIPAEINQELFDKMYGKDVVKTAEEFRMKIAEGLKKTLEADSHWKWMQDIKDYYLEKLKLSLPDEFLKKWLRSANKEITQEQLEEEYDLYAKNLRWQLIEKKIFKENDIRVSREEVKEKIKQKIKEYFKEHGPAEQTDAQLNEYAERTLQDEKKIQQFFEAFYGEKLEILFKSTFTTKTKEVTFDEFAELFQKKQKSGLLSGLKNLIGR